MFKDEEVLPGIIVAAVLAASLQAIITDTNATTNAQLFVHLDAFPRPDVLAAASGPIR